MAPIPTPTPPSLPSRAERFRMAGAPNAAGSFAPQRTAQSAPVAQASVVGVLERLTKVNDDWSVGSVYSDERKAVKVVGAGLSDLVEGNEYTFTGQFKTHKVHGEQLDVVSAAPYVKPDRTSIVRYISKNFKGVGPATAENFLKRRLSGAADPGVALEEVRQQLLAAPWTLDFTGVTKKASYKSDKQTSPVLAYVHRDLATRLGSMPGMKDKVLKLLAAHLLEMHSSKDNEGEQSIFDPEIVQKCWASLIKDPYEPTRTVPGYAFLTADAIGATVNIPRDAPARLKALVAHALELGCQRSGHVYLTSAQLGSALLKLDPRVPVAQSIDYGLQAGMIVIDDGGGEDRYYTTKIHEAETELAQGLAELCRSAAPLSKQTPQVLADRIQKAAKALSPALKDGLDPSQVNALVGIMTSDKRLHTLTAGPGCGKTQLMEVLAKVLEHKEFIFCGPTGKSAKVLSNRLSSLGLEANTIHSTLQGPGRGGFLYNARNQLEGDIIACDETSMNDVELAESIVAATPSNMHMIFMGDDQQLPSIGPGSFLRDILSLKEGDHHHLTKTHRNAGGLLDVNNQVRSGVIECEDVPGVRFSHGLGEAKDEFNTVAARYIDAVSKHGFENVILLMAMRAGDPAVPGWNTNYANAVLRDLCNPHALKIPGTRLFVGDRVIIRENMLVSLAGEDEEDERIVNGDTGSITSFQKGENGRNLAPQSVRLKLDDGRSIDLPGSSLDILQHAYALTVHSSQGSEYKKVIAVFQGGHSSFINKAMLVTALSRAREALDVFAEDAALRKIAATPLPHRNSALAERVRALLAEETPNTKQQARQR